jgi:hypothetical protein
MSRTARHDSTHAKIEPHDWTHSTLEKNGLWANPTLRNVVMPQREKKRKRCVVPYMTTGRLLGMQPSCKIQIGKKLGGCPTRSVCTCGGACAHPTSPSSPWLVGEPEPLPPAPGLNLLESGSSGRRLRRTAQHFPRLPWSRMNGVFTSVRGHFSGNGVQALFSHT